MATAGGATSAASASATSTSTAAPEVVDRSTKELPAPNPDAQAQPCKGRRFLLGVGGELVKNAGGDCVVESTWCTR